MPGPSYRPELGLSRFQGPIRDDHQYFRMREQAGKALHEYRFFVPFEYPAIPFEY